MLYYHGISSDKLARFAEQIDHFSLMFGWCSISEGVDALRKGTFVRPSMSITFDDAQRTVYENALPILEANGIRACVYVVPEYVRKGLSFRDDRPSAIMKWSHLRDWVARGHDIGSHTHTHADLGKCGPVRLAQELRWSKDELEQQLGVQVGHFAYPWGLHTSAVEQFIRDSGLYESVATIYRGAMDAGHPSTRLRRDRADLHRSSEDLETVMRLADRFYWLRKFRMERLERHHDDRVSDNNWAPLPNSHVHRIR